MISIIAAIGKNRELGKNKDLLWKIPDDLKRFKGLTVGHPVIMGRKTYDSILATLGKPLPERVNIIISRNAPENIKSEVIFVSSIEKALGVAKNQLGSEEIFVIGGAQIYALAMPFADKLYLTLIDDSKSADSFFPEYENIFTQKISEEKRDYKDLKYSWVEMGR